MAQAPDDTPNPHGEEPAGTDLAAPPEARAPTRRPDPHPSTAGWDEDEPAGTDLDEGPSRVSPQPDEWEVIDEPEGTPGWEALPRGPMRASAVPWEELQDEARLLPPGRSLVGRTERVTLREVDAPLLARLDTGRVRSVLHAELLGSDAQTVRVRLHGMDLALPRASAAALSVTVQLRLVGADLPVVLRVADATDGEAVVLGCDVLAGRFVVDPARAVEAS